MSTNRYRVDLTPSKLSYRNGTLILETRCEDGVWIWRATKEVAGGESVVLLQRPTMLAFAQDRFGGFDVEAGSVADRIMAKMVATGGAVRMAPGEVFVLPRRRRSV